MRFFISATTRGLGSYRQQVANALRRQGGHEGFHLKEVPADYQTVKTALQNQMRKCDAVICLIGPAFGLPCPASGPQAIRHSYTQFEYELATQNLHKPTFVFFVASDAPLDPFQQDEKDLENQDNFRKTVRAEAELSGRMFFDVRGCDEILTRLSECIGKIAEGVGDFWTGKLQGYPLPLVRAWDFFRDKNNLSSLIKTHKTMDSVLTLLGLSALQAASLGGGLPPRVKVEQTARRANHWVEWLPLIDDSVRQATFFPELLQWFKANQSTLGDLKNALDGWTDAELQFDEDRCEALRVQAAAMLGQIFASLQWTEQYVLAGVTGKGGGEAAVRILRGEAAVSLVLPIVGEVSLAPEERLFFLSLNRRLSLPLWPALWCRSSGYEFQPVQAVSFLSEGSNVSVRLRSLAPGGPRDETIPCDGEFRWWSLPPAWLQSEPLRTRVPGGILGDADVRVCRLFTDDAWRKLDEAIRPAEERRRTLANHVLEREALHKGTRTDLYRSEQEGESQDRFIFHVLPDQFLNDPLARRDLQNRHGRWQRLAQHPSVFPPLPQSDTRLEAEIPFIMTRFLEKGVPLSDWLRRSIRVGRQGLSDQEVIGLLQVAAEVCETAHAAGLRVLQLPTRHFICEFDETGLFDATGKPRVGVTGFDTLFPANANEWADGETPGAFLTRCTRDLAFAPELSHLARQIPPSADVFAVGQLLLQIRSTPPGESFETQAQSRNWRDPWECLIFHCTAEDPSLRFQSAEHMLSVLRAGRWLQDKDCVPCMVPVVGGDVEFDGRRVRVRDFQIGMYPVTNYEYQNFQRSRHRPPYRELPVREAGPWCPVSGVSLDDAEAYCRWLRSRHGGRWRLPREAEWLRAATLEEERTYPWGNEEPDRRRANFERCFDGPSIVGACAAGVSAVGCLDMAGNVWEWCQDFSGSSEPMRVVKGGAYDFTADALRLDTRRGLLRTHRSPHVGFRVVREER